MEKNHEPVVVCTWESEELDIEIKGNQEALLDFARMLRKHGISYHFNYEKVYGGTFMVAVVAELTKEAIKVLVEWFKKNKDRKRKPPMRIVMHGESVDLSVAQIRRIRKILCARQTNN